jgi:hypothetical protein
MTFSRQNFVSIPHFLMHLACPSLTHVLIATVLDEDEAPCDKTAFLDSDLEDLFCHSLLNCLVQDSEHSNSEVELMVDRAYVCQYCSARFESYFELKTHMKLHSHQKVGTTTGTCGFVNGSLI